MDSYYTVKPGVNLSPKNQAFKVGRQSNGTGFFLSQGNFRLLRKINLYFNFRGNTVKGNTVRIRNSEKFLAVF